MKFIRIYILLFTAAYLQGCSPLPEADYYELDGIISVHAKNLPDQNNWVTEPYYTSVSKRSTADAAIPTATLSFSVYVDQPGRYAFWMMTTRTKPVDGNNWIAIWIEDESGYVIDSFPIQGGNSNALEWVSRNHRTGEPIFIDFEDSGHYTVVVDSRGKGGFIADRFHLSLNNMFPPEGMGLPETVDPQIDPRLAKRDQPIAIPPAWAFGVLYGGYTNQAETIERVSKLLDEDYPVDAYWIDSWFWNDGGQGEEPADFLNSVRDTGAYPNPEQIWEFMDKQEIQSGLWIRNSILKHENEAGGSIAGEVDFTNPEIVELFRNKLKPFFETGLDFLKLGRSSDIPFMKAAFEATQQLSALPGKRGFVLSRLHSLHDPDFKQFPTQWSGNAKAVWSQPAYPDFNRHAMGGLKENIEMVANPRLSTYEVPYLTHDTGGFSSFEAPQISDELYLRWVQFAAFNGMMHVFSAPGNSTANMPYNFSEITQNRFKDLTQLRNRLFPYHYSLAHRLRATGQKPVTGDGENTTQFKLGDAFLVAPVYEPGLKNREVYFPDGRWYDYRTGREYRGGRRWVVETSLENIPVFVKAGSIIPYREYSQTILKGSNEHLTVEIYSGGVGTFRLYEDDGVTTRYKEGEFATTAFRYFEGTDYATFTIGALVGGFDGLMAEKEFNFEFKYVNEPHQISVNGEVMNRGDKMQRWSYSSEKREITVKWVQPNAQKTDFRIEW